MECDKCKKDLSGGFTDKEVVVWSGAPNEQKPWKVVCIDCRTKDKLQKIMNQRNKLNRQISSLKKVTLKN